MDASRAFVNELVLETFMEKEKKKKQLNFLTTFYIFLKSDIKTFLKWFINKYPTYIR